jgi:hypothetical protein
MDVGAELDRGLSCAPSAADERSNRLKNAYSARSLAGITFSRMIVLYDYGQIYPDILQQHRFRSHVV